jgi:SAM-dependent methyltransferase
MTGDALKTLPGEHFDVIILSNVLEHLPDRSSFLRQVNVLLKPSRILIRVPLFERDWRVPLKRELKVEWRLDPTHEVEYTLESFREEVTAAGLRITHQEVRWGEIWAEVVPDGS